MTLHKCCGTRMEFMGYEMGDEVYRCWDCGAFKTVKVEK